MKNNEFKDKMADLLQEIVSEPDYQSKMLRIGTTVFCLIAACVALMEESKEKVKEKSQ